MVLDDQPLLAISTGRRKISRLRGTTIFEDESENARTERDIGKYFDMDLTIFRGISCGIKFSAKSRISTWATRGLFENVGDRIAFVA
jgi:hypothetical protein